MIFHYKFYDREFFLIIAIDETTCHSHNFTRVTFCVTGVTLCVTGVAFCVTGITCCVMRVTFVDACGQRTEY